MGATCVEADPACSKSVAKPIPNEVPVEAIEVLVERKRDRGQLAQPVRLGIARQLRLRRQLA